jgi:uncharacterized protein YceK
MRGLRLLVVLLVAMVALSGCGLLPGVDDTGDDPSPSEGSSIVKVTLSWDGPSDMDLEIWDNPGDDLLFRASEYIGTDIIAGDDGDEFFEFRQYGSDDYSAGSYVVSVYFANEEEVADSATVTLTVMKADGSEVTRTGTVYWEPGRDQWHAFRIDAATGDFEDIDEYIEIEITE